MSNDIKDNQEDSQKNSQIEDIKLTIKGRTFSVDWYRGFISVFEKTKHDTKVIDELVQPCIAKPEYDDALKLANFYDQEVKAVEKIIDKLKKITRKSKITDIDLEGLSDFFTLCPSREAAYNILDIHKTNLLRYRIITLLKKDDSYKEVNPWEKFDHNPSTEKKATALENSVKACNDPITQLKKTIKREPSHPNDTEEVIKQREEIYLKDILGKREQLIEEKNKIFECLAQTQASCNDILTEVLSKQWGNESDEEATAPNKKTLNKKIRESYKTTITTKIDTSKLLCKAQNLINHIYDEYYGLVDTLTDGTDFPPSNFHTFGTLVFDLFIQAPISNKNYDKKAALSTRYTAATNFKEAIIESANHLEKIKDQILKKTVSTNSNNKEMKGENIRPVALGLQYFLNVLWIQLQSIDDYLGVDFTPLKESKDSNKSFEFSTGPYWSMYKKKLQMLANSIGVDVSSTVDQLKPHWQRSAIAVVNKQARNFTEVVNSYTQILLRVPRLIIDTKKANFELARIINRIELGLEHQIKNSIENKAAVFSLIKGIANTAGEAANLATSASGAMVTGGMSRSTTTGFIPSDSSSNTSSSDVPLGRIDMKTDGILQGVENLCSLGAEQALREIHIIIKQTYSSLKNDLNILEEMQQCAQQAQEAVLGKEERWLPQMDIEKFETEGEKYLDYLAGSWAASGILNDGDGSSTPGKLERDNLRAKTNEYKAITESLEKGKLSAFVIQS